MIISSLLNGWISFYFQLIICILAFCLMLYICMYLTRNNMTDLYRNDDEIDKLNEKRSYKKILIPCITILIFNALWMFNGGASTICCSWKISDELLYNTSRYNYRFYNDDLIGKGTAPYIYNNELITLKDIKDFGYIPCPDNRLYYSNCKDNKKIIFTDWDDYIIIDPNKALWKCKYNPKEWKDPNKALRLIIVTRIAFVLIYSFIELYLFVKTFGNTSSTILVLKHIFNNNKIIKILLNIYYSINDNIFIPNVKYAILLYIVSNINTSNKFLHLLLS